MSELQTVQGGLLGAPISSVRPKVVSNRHGYTVICRLTRALSDIVSVANLLAYCAEGGSIGLGG